jgi:hypothetical protein
LRTSTCIDSSPDLALRVTQRKRPQSRPAATLTPRRHQPRTPRANRRSARRTARSRRPADPATHPEQTHHHPLLAARASALRSSPPARRFTRRSDPLPLSIEKCRSVIIESCRSLRGLRSVSRVRGEEPRRGDEPVTGVRGR